MERTGGRPDAAALDHLFRRESGRLVSTLARHLGIRHLQTAQDVVQDVFCRALEIWKFEGLPDNPSAWLTAAARNRAIDLLRHDQRTRRLEPAVAYERKVRGGAESERPDLAALFSDEVKDDEVRMMLACCHPGLSERAQAALVLNVLCGFSVREVAAAFLDSEAATGKRLQRARFTLAAHGVLMSISDASAIGRRLPAVQAALYLMFSEGYHGSHPERTVRADLCEEATRLCALLVEHRATAVPSTFALLALMCLGAARLSARLDDAGNLCDLDAQDRSKWNRALAARGLAFLAQAAEGGEISRYHLEAAIAAEHIQADSAAGANWMRIVQCYDGLVAVAPSPVVLLNRAIAIGMADGPEHGLAALDAITARDRLSQYPFYEAALGEFSRRAGNRERARAHFARALDAARAPAERRFLEERLRRL